jgi:CRP/FNR family cyclic AMP-dependent transcriptional regulator
MGEDFNVQSLKDIRFFSNLSDSELKEVLGRITVRKFKGNGIILNEEDTNEFLYMILSGSVKVIRTSEDGKETIIAMHRASDFFGEMTLIDGKTVPATVSAREDSLIALISKEDFHELLLANPKIAGVLLEMLCFRLREAWEKIRILTYRNASLRIKALLLMLANDYGEKTAEGETLNIKLTHQSIADMANLTRETVTRVLDRLQREGEITMLKSRLIRLNPLFFERGEGGVSRQ